MADTPQQSSRIDCHRCVYYYVTYEEQRPHGCRAMGFKSKEIPSLVVLESSGEECRAFEEKSPRRKEQKGL